MVYNYDEIKKAFSEHIGVQIEMLAIGSKYKSYIEGFVYGANCTNQLNFKDTYRMYCELIDEFERDSK